MVVSRIGLNEVMRHQFGGVKSGRIMKPVAKSIVPRFVTERQARPKAGQILNLRARGHAGRQNQECYEPMSNFAIHLESGYSLFMTLATLAAILECGDKSPHSKN